MPGDFHFLRPWWFVVAPGLLWLVVFLNRRSKGTSSWEAVCESHLLPHLLVGKEQSPSRGSWILLGMGWLLALIALAGPTWSKQPHPVLQAQSGLVVLLDLSQSMNAQDVRPSRLTRAKHKVLDILKRRKEGQTALVVFSQEPFVVSPLTMDSATIAAMVPTLTTDLMPVQGSRLDLALETADRLLSQGGISQGHIIVITDGAKENQSREMATLLRTKGHRVSILGVGTAAGAPIPIENGGFLKNRSGGIVIPQFEAHPLEAIAKAGGGEFVQFQNDESDLDRLIVPDVDHALTKDSALGTRTTDLWHEEGPWVVMALIVLALPAFRCGWIGVVLLTLLGLPPSADAWTWEDLWLRSDQQAARQLEKGNLEEAEKLFSDPNWKGVASYRAGDYEQALKSFSKGNTPDTHFNRGNAFARLGKFKEALEAYEKALELNPDHEDAEFNADLIRDLMKQQASQEQPQSGQNADRHDQQSASESEEPKQDQNSQAPENSTASQQSNDQAGQQAEVKGEESHDPAMTQNDRDHQAQLPQDKRNSKQTQSPAHAQDSQESQQEAGEEKIQSTEPGEQSTPESLKPSSQLANSRTRSQQEQESQRATAQWLRQIPDDPGGLLRRKFLLEHQRRQGTIQPGEDPW